MADVEKKFEDGDGEVEVRIPLPEGITKGNAKKELVVKSSSDALLVKIKDGDKVLLDANPLYDTVKSGETSWYVDNGWIVITMQKSKAWKWFALTSKEAIDERFPPVKKVSTGSTDESTKKPEEKDASGALAERRKVDKLLKAAQTGNVEAFAEAAKALDHSQGGLGATVADVKDGSQRSSFHFAAMKGNESVCQYLISELKLPVDEEDEDGETPLIHAARNGHVEVCRLLLDAGADPKRTSKKSGGSAIHYAASHGASSAVELLLARGASVDAPSDNGSPLIWAAGHGQADVAKVLLENGADPKCQTEEGVDALLTAVAAEQREIAQLLLKAGANPNVQATEGVTPLHIAANHGDVRLVSMLLEAGADPNAADESGDKPISAAAVEGRMEVMEALLPVTAPYADMAEGEWSVEALLKRVEHPMASGQKEHGAVSSSAQGNGGTTTKTKEAAVKAKEAKIRGDNAFRSKNFMEAIDSYTQAIDLDPSDSALLSNRSLCWLRQGQPEQALADAQAARQLRPTWPKACYREGAALRVMEKYEEAAAAFYEGVQLDNENKELIDAFKEAVAAGKKAHGVAVQKQGEVEVTVADAL